MQPSNVIPIRRSESDHSARMSGQFHEKLIQRFRAGGKRQREAFARLSMVIEELEAELKMKFGQRSGKLSTAYGPHYMAMKARFCAKQGVAPANLYSTPGAWIEVLQGFAQELGKNEQSLLTSALERAFDVTDVGHAAALADYSDAWLLLDGLKAHVSATVDFVAISEYVARSGLTLEGQTVRVNEWPAEDVGFIDGMVYREWAFDFVPCVYGLNAVTVANESLDASSLSSGDFAFLDDVAAELPLGGQIDLEEARVIGLAFAIEASCGQPKLAMLEWDRAIAIARDADGTTLFAKSVETPEGEPANILEGFTGLGTETNSPPDWHPAGVRVHFEGSAGFDRLLRSTLNQPWTYTSLSPDIWYPLAERDHETYPVSSPLHTTAAVIEGNLLHADEAGHPEQRIDRLLTARLEQIETMLTEFRQQGQGKRRDRRDAILAQWRAAPIAGSTISQEA